MAQNHPAPKSDLDDIAPFIVFGLVGFFLWIFAKGALSKTALYLFAPITYPLIITPSIVGSLYLLCLAGVPSFMLFKRYSTHNKAQKTLKPKDKKPFKALNHPFLLYYVVVFALFALYGVMDNHQMATMSIQAYCGSLDLMNCPISRKDISSYDIVSLTLSGLFINLIIAPLCIKPILTSLASLKQHPQAVMRGMLTTDTLIKKQTSLYPHLLIYDKLNPNTLPALSGQLRLADGVKRFLFDMDLVVSFGFAERKRQNKMEAKDINAPDKAQDDDNTKIDNNSNQQSHNTNHIVPTLDEIKFNAWFNHHLGDTYTTIDNMPPHHIIILACVLPRACAFDLNADKDLIKSAKDDFRNMNRNVWQFWANEFSKHPLSTFKANNFAYLKNFKEYDECLQIVKKLAETEVFKTILRHHAYNSSIVIESMHQARRLGVLEPNHFRWLKFIDRPFWYAVNSLARPAIFAEGLTIIHYLIEKREGYRMRSPQSQLAFKWLQDQAQSLAFTDEEVKAWEALKAGDRKPLETLELISKRKPKKGK